MNPSPPPDLSDADRCLARLVGGSLPARRHAARQLAVLAATPEARDWLREPAQLARLVVRLQAERTPSHDVYDFLRTFRGNAGERETAVQAALFEALGALLTQLGEPVAAPLADLLDGPPLGVGRYWRFGAVDPLVFGAKLTAMDVLQRLGWVDAPRLRRLVRRGDEDPWVVVEAGRIWSDSEPEAAARALWERLSDPRFGRAGEVRSYARHLAPLAPELGVAAVELLARTPSAWSVRWETLVTALADPTWRGTIEAAQAGGGPPLVAALDNLLAVVDPRRCAELRREEGRHLSHAEAPSADEHTLTLAPLDEPGSRLRLAAIVLAAGRGERLGGGKLALPWGSSTVLGTVLANLAEAGFGGSYVVTGHEPERLAPILAAAGAVAVPNPDHASGMLSSVQAGLRALPPVDAALLLPGDMPLVGAATLRRIAAAWRREDGLLIPTYLFQSGHPVVIAASLFGEVERLDPQVGLRQLRDRVPHRVRHLAIDDPAILLDVDTPGDYALHRPPGTPEGPITESQQSSP